MNGDQQFSTDSRLGNNSTLNVNGNVAIQNTDFEIESNVKFNISQDLTINQDNTDKINVLKSHRNQKITDAMEPQTMNMRSKSVVKVGGNFINEGSIDYAISVDGMAFIDVAGTTNLSQTDSIFLYEDEDVKTAYDFTKNTGEYLLLQSKGGIDQAVSDDKMFLVYKKHGEHMLFDDEVIKVISYLNFDKTKLYAKVELGDAVKNKTAAQKADDLAVNSSKDEKEILAALIENEKLALTAYKLKQAGIDENIANTTSSIKQNTELLSDISTVRMASVNEASKAKINTRLAFLQSGDLKLVNAIKKMNYVKLASADNSALKSFMDDNFANQIYFETLAAKADLKSGLDPKIFGFMVGYDKVFDDSILGGYLSYTNSKTKQIVVKTKSYEFGVYAKKYFGKSEINTNLSFATARNDISYEQFILSGNHTLKGKFNSNFINLDATYGHNLDFVTPYFGFEYSKASQKGYDLMLKGLKFQSFESLNSYNLKAKIGAKFIYDFEKANLFVDTKIKQDISRKNGDTVSSFSGSKAKFITKNSNKKMTNFGINIGANVNLSKNLSINLKTGFDANKDDKIYSGSLGLAYKF